ncbi:MAG: ABC transporter [Opitutia bacterium]|nr:FtsX-like permease family protein [Opitutaceae bacterium]PHX73524.1 MAG: ABC transporter [Opitutae bacterium]
MLSAEIFRLAFSSLAANKLRSFLTVLGISVGVFSVIGVMTLIDGMRGSIESGLNVLGANSFQVSKFPPISFSDGNRFRNRRDLTYALANRFKSLMGDSAKVNLQMGRGGQTVIFRDRRTNANVRLIGTDENYVTALNFDIVAGRNLGADDVEYGRSVCLLGFDVTEKLFPDEEALGKTIRTGGQNFTIVGLLASKGSSFGGSPDAMVVTPISRYIAAFGGSSRSINMNVQAPSQTELSATQEKSVGMMRLVRGLRPEDLNDFEIFSNESLIDAFNKIADVVSAGALIISAIALLASGVGVMNIMLVSVTERTKEIGIRKSIGAKKRSILLQFLAEAVALSLIGGIAGVAVGVGGGNAAAYFMNTAINFPWMWAGIGLAVCGGIGVIFGLYPAWKAASLDPIEALRYE